MQWLCNGYATRAKKRLHVSGMDRQWTDNASTLDRLSPEKDRFAQSRKSKVESRKTVRRGGLKDELFIGPKLSTINQKYFCLICVICEYIIFFNFG